MTKPAPRVIRCSRFASVHFDCMTWPLPFASLGDVLRYGEPTRQDLVAASSVLCAYLSLISDPESKRRSVVRNLRHAEKTLSAGNLDDLSKETK